jgi:hypothetical protein
MKVAKALGAREVRVHYDDCGMTGSCEDGLQTEGLRPQDAIGGSSITHVHGPNPPTGRDDSS